MTGMKITVKSSTMVKPMADTPGGTIWLSNVDLLFPTYYHTQALYFYRSDGTSVDFFDTTALKEALSRVLVEFYPYAGRLKKGESNRLEIDCNDEGVLFVEAECDGSLNDLGDFAPKPGLRLIPAVDYSQGISTFPLLLLQLSRFKCGGVCLGIANEHHLCDGISALHFNNSWSGIARGKTNKIPLFFDRTLLSGRNPPRPIFPHVEFQPPPQLLTPLDADSETAYSVLKITPDQLKSLKEECNNKYSSYEVLAGHVWRCVCRARGLPAHQKTKFNIPVEGRNRLQPPLPPGFFGNVLFFATPVSTCGELASNPLTYAVGLVHTAIARMDDEYLRSALDYLELQGDVCAKARGPHTTKCPNLQITSWTRLPAYEVDFGWGKPVYVGPGAPPFEGKSFLMQNPDEEGGLLYAITLHKQHINLFHNLFYKFN